MREEPLLLSEQIRPDLPDARHPAELHRPHELVAEELECADGARFAARAGAEQGRTTDHRRFRAQCDRRILITFNNRDFRKLDGIVPHAGMLFCPQGAEFIPEIQRVCLRLAEEGVGALS